MKRNRSIQLKAAFLLIVFALNTLIGFSCAVGIDMGFSNKHHHEAEATKHHHHSKEDSEKGGCCSDKVIRFQNLDKDLNQNTGFSIPVFAVTLSTFFSVDIFKQVQVSNQKHIVQFFHPPPPDIRILIQSFQI